MDENVKQEEAKEQDKSGEEGKEQFDAKAAITAVDGKIDKLIATLEKGKNESFDPVKLLKELGAEEEQPSLKKGTEKEGEQDFENMTPKDFAQFVVGSTLKEVQTALKPLVDRVEVLRVRSEVGECKEKYSDFMDFKEDVFKAAMNNPSLSLEDAYLKVAGGKRVAEQRTATEKRAKEDKEKEERERRAPFLPSERGGHDRRATKEEPTDIEGAAVLALRDVLGVEK